MVHLADVCCIETAGCVLQNTSQKTRKAVALVFVGAQHQKSLLHECIGNTKTNLNLVSHVKNLSGSQTKRSTWRTSPNEGFHKKSKQLGPHACWSPPATSKTRAFIGKETFFVQSKPYAFEGCKTLLHDSHGTSLQPQHHIQQLEGSPSRCKTYTPQLPPLDVFNFQNKQGVWVFWNYCPLLHRQLQRCLPMFGLCHLGWWDGVLHDPATCLSSLGWAWPASLTRLHPSPGCSPWVLAGKAPKKRS